MSEPDCSSWPERLWTAVGFQDNGRRSVAVSAVDLGFERGAATMSISRESKSDVEKD